MLGLPGKRGTHTHMLVLQYTLADHALLGHIRSCDICVSGMSKVYMYVFMLDDLSGKAERKVSCSRDLMPASVSSNSLKQSGFQSCDTMSATMLVKSVDDKKQGRSLLRYCWINSFIHSGSDRTSSGFSVRSAWHI